MHEKNDVLHTSTGNDIKILETLGSGGQGDVYKVSYKGKEKAFKWLRNCGDDSETFYSNMKKNVTSGKPDDAFLWPEAVTLMDKNNQFGYIMDLRPDGYYEIKDFLLTKVKFPSFMAVAEAGLKIVNAFRKLHIRGLSYQDLNDGNFFINPKTADVKICDNDNVAPSGTNIGIIGKPRYLAPEIAEGKSLPNSDTDKFSLAIILFLLFMNAHPLEGKEYFDQLLMDDDTAKKIYGFNAKFIFDENNKSNRAIAPQCTNAINRWKFMPDYLKEIFLRAFAKKSITNPDDRVQELEWIKVLARFRNDIVRCSCGNEVFYNKNVVCCDDCNKKLPVDFVLQLPDYQVPCSKGGKIFRCQLGTVSDSQMNSIVFVLGLNANQNGDKVLSLKNVTTDTLECTTPSGGRKLVHAGGIIPLRDGIHIAVANKDVIIKKL